MVALERNPVDAVWPDRPPPPAGPAVPYPLALAGEDAADKRAEIAEALREAGQDAAVISDPASIAWLFNLRGEDVAFTPVALGFALMRADATATLFMAPAKLPAETRAWLGNAVACEPRAALPEALAALRGQTVRVDPAGTPAWFARTLREAGAIVADGPDPCLLPKACKNATEQAGARAAHARDAVAICRFLHWFAAAAPAGGADRERGRRPAAGLACGGRALPRREFSGDRRRRRARRHHPLPRDAGDRPADPPSTNSS